MSDLLKVSGKKVELPQASAEWTFTPRPGGWVIAERTVDGKKERKRVAAVEQGGKLSFSIDGFLFFTEVQTKQRGGVSAASVEDELKAQFPGKVRKVLVEAGASVEAGVPLLLIEAMKMEFSVKAPVKGKVRAVLVKEGQQLSPGDKFLDFEPAEGAQ